MNKIRYIFNFNGLYISQIRIHICVIGIAFYRDHDHAGNPKFTNHISNSALTLTGHFAAPYPVIDKGHAIRLKGICGTRCINVITLTRL